MFWRTRRRQLGLKVARLFIAVKADSDRMIPAPGGDSSALMRALVTEALATGTAVVLGELDVELLLAVVAMRDFVVRYPVCRPGSILHKTCKSKKKRPTMSAMSKEEEGCRMRQGFSKEWMEENGGG